LLGQKEGANPALASLTDMHGDLVATYSSTALATTTAYDPFGAITDQTGAKTNLGYQGEYTDPDTGKVNMHARWYQPGTGTFTSRDTMTLSPNPSIQANRYTYANASPLTHTDPTGHWAVEGNPASGGSGWQDWAPTPGNSIPTAATADPDEGWICGSWGGCFRVRDPLYSWGNSNVGDGRIAEYDPQWHFDNFVRGNGYLNNRAAIDPIGYDNASLEFRTAYRRAYYSGLSAKKLKEFWSYLTSVAGGSSGPGAPTCSSYYGSKGCKAIREAAQVADATKNFYNECLGPSGGTIERCHHWRDIAGISDEEWLRLRREFFDKAQKGDADNWIQSLLDKAGNFFFEDAEDCLNGSVAGCGLFALNFVPGVGVAKAGIKVLGKVATKLGPAGSKVAKACGNSFAPGTLVLMADGSHKPIEEVQIGDHVISTDPLTGETAAKKVTDLIVGTGTKDLIEITVTSSGEYDSSLTATAEHPFWVPTSKQWVNATDLAPGMWLRTSAGTHVQVDSIKQRTVAHRVHNMTISDLHTYYVLAGTTSVLVHNSAPCNPPLKSLHPDSSLTKSSLDFWRKQDTKDILKSLSPGAREALRVKPDGTIMNGNTRIKILRERGYDVDSLPREIYGRQPMTDEDFWKMD
jgi:RHS repeat-associated protein